MIIITHDPTGGATGQVVEKKTTGHQKTTITAFPEVFESTWSASKAMMTDADHSTLKTKVEKINEPPVASAAEALKQAAAAAVTAPVDASTMSDTQYDDIINRAAQQYGVEPSLIKAMIKMESDFNPNCVSSSGAVGLMQLMPETAKFLGVTNSYDPEQNIMGGTKYIAQKLEAYNGDLELALSAYNAGSGTVKKYGGVPPQCRLYISKILSYKKAYEVAAAVS